MTRYSHLISWVSQTPWAIYPPKLMALMDALAFLSAGGEYAPAEIEAIVGASPRPPKPQAEINIAVLPLRGVIAHRAGMMTQASGGTSVESFSAQFREFVADENISAIVLDVDSPGGAVPGVEELAAEIYAARKAKRIVAHVNAMAASAAYWIASAASEISVTPSGEVGSIGVIAAHEDRSARLEKLGVKTSLITAGKYKSEGNPYGPLDGEARAYLQSQVDAFYGMFTRAVARGRGATVAQVREGYGEGRMVLARDALKMGMVDHIETMDELMKRLRLPRETEDANQPANSRGPRNRTAEEEPEGRSTAIDRVRLELLKRR